ncbi:FGGY-family carbohydrate kinase [Gluconobacter kanchanaburiensis]|uniref:Carbohydrate kinase n=1 Tax=Gluconobacter kanchanaburiensis NBRC 103587 TaxID=1307948 RepID=A0A511BF92_9PROT|nr:FGGY-family carbohydrate kinase [Gluconobacter kanchanaburiensis]GBR68656.1 L-xylulose kinase LyxK [Gluconobacter kanchanaburiensis NBRC 103587]GEK96447.1 carbohydrate kinase [Gluconobacter kanchanaburiensis NBRC 103587]
MTSHDQDPLVLAIDAGGTAVKVSLFDAQGRIVRLRNAEVTTHHYPDGRVERDPDAFWQATVHAIRDVLQGECAKRVRGVGCTGFGNGVFVVDAEGKPTHPGIVSVDHRAQPVADRVIKNGNQATLGDMNGHRPWGGQTLIQLVGLSENVPSVMAETRWALACKDFIRLRLTDAPLTDPSDASGGGLMNLQRRDYATEAFSLLGQAGLVEKLPEIVGSSAIAGRISARAAAETGLPEGLPVSGSMMDVASCALGAGVTTPAHMVLIAGTWAINAMEVSETAPNRYPLLNMLYRDKARLVAEGSPSSAANLGWYLKHAMGDRLPVSEALKIAETCPVADQRCYFLPYIHGPKPWQASFLRLSATDNDASMIRAICEGVAFEHRRHAEALLQYGTGEWPEAIRLTGGAARSPFWAQIFADACNKPVEVVDTPEVGALGAAICAAVASGLYDTLEEAASKMSRISCRLEPIPEHVAILEDRYREFSRLDRGIKALLSASA